MPSSDVRSSETSAQNAQDKNFQKFTCSNFRGSYFRVLVVGRAICENLDLAKISRYTVNIDIDLAYVISCQDYFMSRHNDIRGSQP